MIADVLTGEARVHVHGAKDPDGPLKRDERTCAMPDRGEIVVFHPRSETVGEHYRCPDCGETDGPQA